MIGVIDSKICNIYSITNMLKKLNAKFIVIDSKDKFSYIDKLILPGVGAFKKAMENLNKFDLLNSIIDFANKNYPILGICLGMQLLFSESEEFGICKGLNLINGKVIKIKTNKVLPHMGWNNIIIKKDNNLIKNLKNNSDFYFVHSYRVETDDQYIIAITEYDDIIPAIVCKQNIFGTQFHPEKSQICGEIILTNFINL